MMRMRRKSRCTTTTADGSCSNLVLLLVFTERNDNMTWHKIKDWKFEYNNNTPKLSIVESEEIDESEISNIVYETISTDVIDDMIDDYYDDVEICGNKYPASIALKSTDGVAYDDMKNDCCEIKIDEIINELPDKPTTYQAMVNQCLIYWE